MIDTADLAERLKTDTKRLRSFLRSPKSPYQPVGSGGRYEFTEDDVHTLGELFHDWLSGRASKSTRSPVTPKPRTHEDEDLPVFEEESRPLVFPNINDPRVRAEVRRKQQEAEWRLDQRLLAKGLHITQQR